MIDIIILLLKILKYPKKIRINACNYNVSFVHRSYTNFKKNITFFLDYVYLNCINWHILKYLINEVQLHVYIKY